MQGKIQLISVFTKTYAMPKLVKTACNPSLQQIQMLNLDLATIKAQATIGR
jgi:hypothetical protein